MFECQSYACGRVSPKTRVRATYSGLMTYSDPYGRDVLSASSPRSRRRPESNEVPVAPGLVVEDAESGWVGAIVGFEKTSAGHVVHLEDRRGRTRPFPLGPGYLIDGSPVRLVRPVPRTRAPGRTASGSVAVPEARARVARGSRIWVEGKHDAELVEKIWGDDLRVEGVVVELLEGVDHLAEVLRDFRPGPTRRAGVLVDHFVPGSKETRLVREALAGLGPAARNVLVVGHPYIDVWQAIKPGRLGLERWPDVPRGIDIKIGTLRALGWPHAGQPDVASGWKRLLGRVRDYRDLEPALLGRLEELIDFVTLE